MEIGSIIRNILEIGFGIIFLIGGIFNSLYTYKNGEKFFGSFAKGAWLPPARWLVEKIVLPNTKVFTVLMVIFQFTVALAILSRGPHVSFALYAGTAFAVFGVFVSNIPGGIANLVMALTQYYLAITR